MTSLMIASFGVCAIMLLPIMSQPLTLGLTIMALTLLNCLLISLFQSSWYGYILFLVFVGGLLVMFAYVAALCPNFLASGGILTYFCAGFLVIFTLLYNLNFSDLKALSDLSSTDFFYLSSFGLELVSSSNVSILVGLGLILLINLVAVVKVCYFSQGSLRPFKS